MPKLSQLLISNVSDSLSNTQPNSPPCAHCDNRMLRPFSGFFRSRLRQIFQHSGNAVDAILRLVIHHSIDRITQTSFIAWGDRRAVTGTKDFHQLLDEIDIAFGCWQRERVPPCRLTTDNPIVTYPAPGCSSLRPGLYRGKRLSAVWFWHPGRSYPRARISAA